ncbi:TrgA family protein [Roseovarius aestuariivivens]|uniref:TrgA family protein n=1 Tax=Roseovarius aestuariivivens TaxID=1888910 RepID=UPI001080706A|nr:TrgA family protein [Roseovarius aestuariivivens]
MPVSDRMPTTGKGVAALLMAVLAWYASEMFRPLMPEGTNFGWFNEVNVALGLLSGWIVIGSRLGRGLSDGISAGLTGVAAMVFWAVFLQSSNEMLRLALERRYDGPVEGLVAVFEIAFDFVMKMAHVPLIALLVGGGIVIGIISEFVARRWS